MTDKRIGSLIFLKYCGFTVLFVGVVVIFYALMNTEPLLHLALRLFDGFKSNFIFISGQIFCVILGALFLGRAVARQVIEKRRNTFVIGGLAFIILWIVLFWFSALMAAAIDSFAINKFFFAITLNRWIKYHSLPFLVLGIIHGLSLGLLTAREIRRKGGDFV